MESEEDLEVFAELHVTSGCFTSSLREAELTNEPLSNCNYAYINCGSAAAVYRCSLVRLEQQVQVLVHQFSQIFAGHSHSQTPVIDRLQFLFLRNVTM